MLACIPLLCQYIYSRNFRTRSSMESSDDVSQNLKCDMKSVSEIIYVVPRSPTRSLGNSTHWLTISVTAVNYAQERSAKRSYIVLTYFICPIVKPKLVKLALLKWHFISYTRREVYKKRVNCIELGDMTNMP